MKTDKQKLIESGCKNMIAGTTITGGKAADLYFQRDDFGADPRCKKWFNDGFPFRIWRDSGIGYVTGRNRPEYGIDGQARTAELAVEMAGNDGVVVIYDEEWEKENNNEN